MPTGPLKTEQELLAELRVPISLKEHLIVLIDERERKFDQRILCLEQKICCLEKQVEGCARKSEIDLVTHAQDKALGKAETANETRFQSVNEFRQQMADMQATLVRKNEVDLRFGALENKVDVAVGQLQQRTGRDTGINAVWAVIGIVASLILSGIGIATAVLLKH